MANKNKKKPVIEKITGVKEAKAVVQEISEKFERLQEKDKMIFFKNIGVGGDATNGKYYTCYLCGGVYRRASFHMSSDLNVKSGVCRCCKKCLTNIAIPLDEDNKRTNPTKESVKAALEYIDRPFHERLWTASLEEAANTVTGKTKNNVYTSYIKNVSMPQYYEERYHDSDEFNSTIIEMDDDGELSDDVKELYAINKRTTLRFLGYDPFENEPENEKPLLYSKLVNYFDDSVKDDGLKLEAVIEIVQSFKDVKTINDAISKYKKQLGKNPQVISTIKSLADTKQKMINSALALAKDNGISENNNNRKSKGAGTLSGIIKELQELNLEEAEINIYDYETNLALEDIMTRNHENQLRQLNPDENDWEKEVHHQKTLLFKLQKERDDAVEFSRLLKKENMDLKDYMFEKGLIDRNGMVIEDE